MDRLDPLRAELAQVCRQRRFLLGLTQAEVARRAELSEWTYRMIERGHDVGSFHAVRTLDKLGIALEWDFTPLLVLRNVLR